MPSASVALTSTISLSGSRAPTDGSREHAVVEQSARRRSRRSARAPAARARARRSSSSSPRASSSARERSIEANRLADGLVVSSTSKAASSRPRSRWPVSRASSTAPGVNEVSALCVEIATASAPSASAEAGTSGWKPKWPAQAWSQISGIPRACASSAMRSTCDTTPSQDGSTSRIARASGLGLERGLDRLDRMAERDAASLVDGRSDPHRSRAREHEARGDRLVRAARDDHGLALGRDRQAERLVGVRGAVAREAAEIGAEGARRERARRAPGCACLPRRSSAPPCIGASPASSGSSPISAGLRLCPGVENAVGDSRRKASTASANGVSGAVTSRDAMRPARGGAAARSWRRRSRRARPWRSPRPA